MVAARANRPPEHDAPRLATLLPIDSISMLSGMGFSNPTGPILLSARNLG